MNLNYFNKIRISAIMLILFSYQFAYTQSGGLNNMATRILNTDYSNKIGNNLNEVKGSPFLSGNWDQAYLYLATGEKFYLNKIKFNGYTGELHYIDEKGIELAIVDGSVTKVAILDSKDTTKILKKFAAFSDQNKNNRVLFFEVHNDGAIQLVTREEKYIFTENYDPLKGKTEQYFKTTLFYAIGFNGSLTFIPDLGFNNIISALPKPTKIEIDKKIKMKSIKDVVVFLNQYNQINK